MEAVRGCESVKSEIHMQAHRSARVRTNGAQARLRQWGMSSLDERMIRVKLLRISPRSCVREIAFGERWRGGNSIVSQFYTSGSAARGTSPSVLSKSSRVRAGDFACSTAVAASMDGLDRHRCAVAFRAATSAESRGSTVEEEGAETPTGAAADDDVEAEEPLAAVRACAAALMLRGGEWAKRSASDEVLVCNTKTTSRMT